MELGHYVYLMQDKSVPGFYKIGHSYNPNAREATLLAAKPVISIVAKCRFYSDMEAKITEGNLHQKYKPFRKRGEWFELCDKKVEEILVFFTDNHLTTEKEIELLKKENSFLNNKNYHLENERAGLLSKYRELEKDSNSTEELMLDFMKKNNHEVKKTLEILECRTIENEINDILYQIEGASYYKFAKTMMYFLNSTIAVLIISTCFLVSQFGFTEYIQISTLLIFHIGAFIYLFVSFRVDDYKIFSGVDNVEMTSKLNDLKLCLIADKFYNSGAISELSKSTINNRIIRANKNIQHLKKVEIKEKLNQSENDKKIQISC